MNQRVLVIGATRILRPAALELATAGVDVIAVARTGSRLAELAAESARIHPWRLDYRDLDALRSTSGVTSAIVYAPNARAGMQEVLRAAVDGRVVQLLPSEAASVCPDRPFSFDRLPAPPPRWCRVVLGWTKEGTWHDPRRISAAALAGLRDGHDRLLGLVRPWAARPEAGSDAGDDVTPGRPPDGCREP